MAVPIERWVAPTSVGFVFPPEMAEAWAREPAFVLLGDFGTRLIPAPSVTQPEVTAQDPSAMLSRQDVARWLRVSTRWVERHLTPSAQATRRGRAWYTREDVEAQLAKMNLREMPRSRRSTDGMPRTPAQRRARNVAARAGAPQSIEHEREVAAIEAKLRSSVERRRTSRGER